MNQSTTRSNDALFGPQLPGRFDFTLLFEQSIFTVLPCSLFLVASVANIYALSRQPVRVKSGILLWLKLGTVTALLATQVASAVLSEVLDTRTKMTVAASVLSCLSSAALLPLLYKEHRRSVRSSSVVGLFLSATMLFDATRARSYGMRDGLQTLSALASLEAAWKLGILLLEEVSKKSLVQDQQALGPEMTSGFWNRSLFVWLNEMLLLGFKNVISVDDLPQMGPSFETEMLHEQFQQQWATANKESRYGMLFALAKTMKWSLLAVVVPRLCFSAFTYVQPLLLKTIVSSVTEKQQQEVVGGLIGATVLVYFGLAITRASYQHFIYRSVTLMRGHMVSAILDKATRLRLSEAKKAAAATLMNADIQGLIMGITYLHNIWASVIELGVGLYLLARLVGAASFLVAVPAAIITAISMALAKRMGPARMVWMKAIQKRVSGTSAILGQLKAIKMAGMATGVAKSVQNLRVVEVARSVGFRRLSVMLFGLSEFSQAVTPIVVLAGGIFWTGSSKQLHAADVFSTLSVIALVSSPLNTLLNTAPALASIMSSVDRLQKFLLQDEAEDTRERLGRDVPENTSEEGTELENVAKQGIEMEFTDADIPAGDNAEALLRNVNLSIKTGSLVMITGAVGSGKSVLLKAILGEGRLTSGSLAIRTDDMAYCDQSAWLRNVSIKNNILAHSGVDEARYEAVIRACLLDEDLLQIPGGDAALAGSDGISLSGGQKQRIALARAVYSQRPVLVLDDVFSALDARTAKTLFQRVFGKEGLLRRANATVIMATHATRFYHEADQLISVEEGRVKEIDIPLPSQEIEDSEEAAEPTASSSASQSSPQTPPPKTKQQGQAPDKQRQLGDLSLYSFYIQACGAKLFLGWMILVAISCVWTKMPNIFVSIWLGKDPSNNSFFAGYAALGGTSVLFGMVMLFVYMFQLVPASAENLHWMLVDTVVKATLPFLSATDSGTILNRFGQDMTLINQSLPRAVSQTAIRLFTVIVDLALIVAGAKYAAAAIPVLLLVLYAVQKYYLRTSRQMRHLDLEAKAPLFTQLTETAAGSEHVRAFGWQQEIKMQGFQLLDASQRPYYHMFAIQRWLELVLDLCVLGIATVVVSLALSFTETTSQAAVGLALLNVISFSAELSMLLQMWIDLETSLGAVARLKSFTRDTPLEKEPESGAYAVEASCWPKKGAIEFANVTARYDAESRPVLDDVSFKIHAGQKVGIVGRTGSGKSSLLLTLLHMLEYEGSITIDGVEVSSIKRDELRASVTTITQDAISLEGSVLENLLPFLEGDAEVDADDAKEALEKVGLWDHISAQGGLQASLAEVGLSQGQKQLLSLARALLHHKRRGGSVVLVDEATSSVDGETDRRMQQVMGEAFATCTVLTIAHRLETLAGVDVVLELSAGKVTQQARV